MGRRTKLIREFRQAGGDEDGDNIVGMGWWWVQNILPCHPLVRVFAIAGPSGPYPPGTVSVTPVGHPNATEAAFRPRACFHPPKIRQSSSTSTFAKPILLPVAFHNPNVFRQIFR